MNAASGLFAANEALAPATASIATGLARSTINRGVQELRPARNDLGSRLRRPGGGRKSAVAHQPELPAALERLIAGAIRGDPMSPLRWVSRSQRHLVKELTAQGFKVSQRVVGKLLRELEYSCRASCKTREGSNNPDRNAQFEHVNKAVQAAIVAGEPAISVDTKTQPVRSREEAAVPSATDMGAERSLDCSTIHDRSPSTAKNSDQTSVVRLACMRKIPANTRLSRGRGPMCAKSQPYATR